MVDGFDAAEQLREHVSSLSGGELRRSEIVDLMRRLRLLADQKGLKNSHPHIALYCDWVLHTEIDRHRLALKILETMNDAVSAYDEKSGNIIEASRALSLHELRSEMLDIFKSYSIPTELLDSFTNWKMLVRFLLNDLKNKPVKIPKATGKLKEKIADATSRMTEQWKKRTGADFAATSVFITNEPRENNEFFWNLACYSPSKGGNITVKSALLLTEDVSKFLRP